MSISIDKQTIINQFRSVFGPTIERKTLIDYIQTNGMKMPNWLINGKEHRLSRGIINLTLTDTAQASVAVTPTVQVEAPAMQAQVVQLRQKKMVTEVENLIPERDSNYVPFGFFRDMESIIKSKVFYPIFITGLSGNGKTTMVEQVCAKLKRECVRVNVSIETDEDDLVGGATLIDGNVTFREGPVLTAMRRGAVLLIDEIDRGSNKLMCIQAVLEGKPYFNKKNGDVVYPSPGFTVVATANTKGQGSDSGKFIAAQILDEAFLERFPITVEQEYPTPTIERRILTNYMTSLGKNETDFVEKLVAWSEVIRKSYIENAVDEMISTRRLVHIVKAFTMFNDRQKAIELCVNRFDADTKSAFLDLYKKMEEPVPAPVKSESWNPVSPGQDEEIPF